MDIQKEREAFEAWFTKSHYHKHLIENFWDTWQAAKAQAVPEGFVLAPKYHQQNIRDALVIACDVQEDEQRFEDSLNYVHKAMLEAQEQNHESK